MPFKTEIAEAEARLAQAENAMRDFESDSANDLLEKIDLFSERFRLRDAYLQAQLDLIHLQMKQIEDIKSRIALDPFGLNPSLIE